MPVTPKDCDEVERLVSLITLRDPAGTIPIIDRLPDAEPCIAAGLRRAVDEQDWLTFERYVIAATRRPHTSMTPVLADVLLRHDVGINYADIVDALGEIADPGSVCALAEALIWEPPWDEFRHLAAKATWALGRVGTAEARLLLEGAAETGEERVREAAAYELRRWRPRSTDGDTA